MELQPFEIAFETTKVIKSKALAEFTTEWTDPFTDEPPEVESTLPGEEALGLWVLHFDGAFNLPDAGARAVLTSPTGDKLCYAIQLSFKPEHKVYNNIAEYEGLLVGLRVASALGIKCLIVKGYSQLVVNFSNKSYTPKDEHTMDYLEEHRKMEKCFQGLELKHIPRGDIWRWTKSPSAPLIAWRSRTGSPKSASSSHQHLRHQQGQKFLPSCRRHRSKGLWTAGHPQATASSWRWQGRKEWIGSSSSRPSSSAANSPKRNRRPKESRAKLHDIASRTAICNGVAQAESP
jgi:ribonuclease HI